MSTGRTRIALGWLLTLGAVLASGCSWIFDDTAPELPLVGDPPVMERFLKLNQKPARDAFLIYDGFDKPWAVIPELPALPVGIPDGVTLPNLPELIRLVRLDPQEDPTLSVTYPSQYLLLTLRSLYIMVTPQLFDPQSKDKSVFLTRVRPGQSPELLGQFPEGTPVLLVSSNEQTGVMISQSSKSKALRVFRMDGTMDTRDVPIPEGVDPAKPFDKGRYQLDGSGEHLFVQDGKDVITVYETRSKGGQLSLGKQLRTWVLDSRQAAFLMCGETGLTRLPVDGSPATTLDALPCSQDVFRLTAIAGKRVVLYKSGDGLRQVAEDGSTAAEWRMDSLGQLLALGTSGELLYSTDPPATYGAGIGSGFLGSQQVIERGRRPAWSADRSRLRYLEWAARSDGAGDFHSRQLASSEVLRIARNVRSFAELSDGRVVAVSNSVPRGTHNRVIVVDENLHLARWVADSSRDFLLIPGSSDLIAKVVIGQTGWDIRRVPIPPR